MGGSGSGWRWSKNATVEDCLTLSMRALRRRRAIVTGAWSSGTWGWKYDWEDQSHATIGYEANLCSPEDAWLRLHYSANGERVDYRVRLVSTKPAFGGVRWWFTCPLVRHDGGSPRRVAKLHLPPGRKYFGSREGYGLTYKSCQESGQFRSLFRTLAADTGTDEASVRIALRKGW